MLVHYMRLTYRHDTACFIPCWLKLLNLPELPPLNTSPRNRVHLVTADNYMRLTSSFKYESIVEESEPELVVFSPQLSFSYFQYQHIRKCLIELFAAVLFLDRCELYDSNHLCGVNQFVKKIKVKPPTKMNEYPNAANLYCFPLILPFCLHCSAFQLVEPARASPVITTSRLVSHSPLLSCPLMSIALSYSSKLH